MVGLGEDVTRLRGDCHFSFRGYDSIIVSRSLDSSERETVNAGGVVMRLLRALRDFFSDLFSGDPVALGIAGFFLLLVLAVGGIWIADRIRRKKEADAKKGKKKKP